MRSVSLFAMSRKGYVVLRDLINHGLAKHIDSVVIARDQNMANDYYEEMYTVCKDAGIRVYDRNEHITIKSLFCIAVSWRWLIPLREQSKLIVFHDSLLPRYRGFSPLVNMLINKEPFIGVTALYASQEYDQGEIIAQKSVVVNYPIKITDAIDLITPLYSDLAVEIINKIRSKQSIISVPQNEDKASYSLWRNEDDYRIDWNSNARDIQQFVYSVGYPYKGAVSMVEGALWRIMDCEIAQDAVIENRTPGKIVFIKNGMPIVVCKEGMIKITDLRDEKGECLLPLKKFRIKFQ